MSDVVRSVRPRASTAHPIRTSSVRRRRDDTWIAATALVAALLVLPFAQSSWHGAEASAILAVAATAMFAGQRWAIAPVVLSELLLLPTLWPRAFAGLDLATAPSPEAASFVSAIVALVTLAALVPGVLAMRRAAAAVALVSGWRRTRRTMGRLHAALVVIAVVATLLPIL